MVNILSKICQCHPPRLINCPCNACDYNRLEEKYTLLLAAAKKRKGNNMTSSRELAEKIVLMTRQDRYAKATELESAIESLLGQAMEENLKHEIRERLGLLETIKIKEAIERAVNAYGPMRKVLESIRDTRLCGRNCKCEICEVLQ